MKAGENHYMAYVGPPENYDLMGATQFNLLTAMGLRQNHTICDIGCGSLRAGKLIIPFLEPKKYHGLEPNQWLVDDGIKNQLGQGIIEIKKPSFESNESFDLSGFEQDFDFMVAQSIFSHTSIDQIHQCLQQAKVRLKPNGYFLATFVHGKENYEGNEWVYPGCVTYTKKKIMSLIRENGLDAILLPWDHPNKQRWYLIFHPQQRQEAEKKAAGIFKVNKIKFDVKAFILSFKLFNNSFTWRMYRLIKK